MNTLSKQDIIDISTSIAQLLASKLGEVDDKDTVVVEVEHKKQPRVFTKKKEDYCRVQVQNKKPLAPSYEIHSPVKDRLLKKENTEQILDDTEELVKCSICGELFKPTSKINTICSNKTCKLINKYDRVIEKHSNLRMAELGDNGEAN